MRVGRAQVVEDQRVVVVGHCKLFATGPEILILLPYLRKHVRVKRVGLLIEQVSWHKHTIIRVLDF